MNNLVLILILILLSSFAREEAAASDPERALRNYLLAKDSNSKYEWTMKKVPKEEFQIYYRKKLLKIKSVDALEIIAQNADTTVILATFTYTTVRDKARSLIHVYVLSPVNGEWRVDWKGQVYQKYLAAMDRLVYTPFDYYAIIDKSDFFVPPCFYDAKSGLYSFRDEAGYQDGNGYSSFYFYGATSVESMQTLRKFLIAGPRVVRLGLVSPDAAGCRYYSETIGMRAFAIAHWEPAKHSLAPTK